MQRVYSIKTVSRLFVVPLVLLLSGIPAAAIVCDLMLCQDPAKAASDSSGCHDHSSTDAARKMIAADETCTHASAIEPYVAVGFRVVFSSMVSEPVAPLFHTALPLRSGGEHIVAHSPPDGSLPVSSRPLRI